MSKQRQIEKLLRLAAPGSGASEAERQSAAIEAAKLFAQEDLTIAERPLTPREAAVRDYNRPPARPTRPAPQKPSHYSPSIAYETPRRMATPWVRSRAPYEGGACAEQGCQGPIAPHEEVWRRVKGATVEYLHLDCPAAETKWRRQPFHGFDY